eukprot:2492252-Prymnesium_polylepis.1
MHTQARTVQKASCRGRQCNHGCAGVLMLASLSLTAAEEHAADDAAVVMRELLLPLLLLLCALAVARCAPLELVDPRLR